MASTQPMTTTPDDTAARAALARLQESPRAPKETIPAWLDVHQADVITLCMAKGQRMATELLGLNPTTVSGWKHNAGLTFKAPILSRDGSRRLGPQNIAPQHLPMPSPNGAHPDPEQTTPEPQAPAAAHSSTNAVLPTPRRANYAKYIIMENGHVLDIATGKLVHLEAP